MKRTATALLLIATLTIPSAHAVERRGFLKMLGLSAGGVFAPKTTPGPASVPPADPALAALRTNELTTIYRNNLPRYAMGEIGLQPADLCVARRQVGQEVSAEFAALAEAHKAEALEHVARVRMNQPSVRPRVDLGLGDRAYREVPRLGMGQSETHVPEVLRRAEDRVAARLGLNQVDLQISLKVILDPEWLIQSALNGSLAAFAPRLVLTDELVDVYVREMMDAIPSVAMSIAERYYKFVRDEREDFGEAHIMTRLGLTRFHAPPIFNTNGAMEFEFTDTLWQAYRILDADARFTIVHHAPERVVDRYLTALKQIERLNANLRLIPDSALRATALNSVERLRVALATELKEMPTRYQAFVTTRAWVDANERPTISGPGLMIGEGTPAEPAAMPPFLIGWETALNLAVRGAGLIQASELLAVPEEAAACAPHLTTEAPAALTHQPISAAPRNLGRGDEALRPLSEIPAHVFDRGAEDH